MPFPLKQPKTGYRYGIDSFFLAHFANFSPTDKVCDLGAGCGILSVLAIEYFGVSEVTAIEVQPELFSYLLENQKSLLKPSCLKPLKINWNDAREHLPPHSFDKIITNPPYRKIATGRLSSSSSKQIAKHEILGNLRNLLESAKRLLKHQGTLSVIYPVLRLEEILIELQLAGMKAQRIRFVHPYIKKPATHVMLEAVKSPVRELKVEAPLIVYQEPGLYTEEIKKQLDRNHSKKSSIALCPS